MPMVVALGLPSLDRSLFGFRKTDRSTTASSPVPDPIPAVELTLAADDLGPAPALPPLHALNFNSFANLLDHVEVSPSASTTAKSKQPVSTEVTLVTEPAGTSSSETLTWRNVKSTDKMGNLEFMTTGTYFSTMAPNSSSSVPTRHQSSTSSSASMSKRSDTDFSDESTSSRSSVDDTLSKDTPSKQSLSKKRSFIPLGPIQIDPINTDFLAVGFESKELGIQLKHAPSSGSSTPSVYSPSSPVLDTNKPLPPAPSAGSRHSKVSNGRSVPELDAGVTANGSASKNATNNLKPELDAKPARRDSRDKGRVQNNKSASNVASLNSRQALVRTSSSLVYPAIDDEKQVVPPRKAPLKQRSRKNIKEGNILTMADQVILQILLRVQTISDLKSIAMTNKRFYRVFKRNETQVVESVLKIASPAGWELRQLVQREQKRSPYQIRAVQRDLAALRALQAFILMRCGKLCRPSTVEGLMGDSAQRRADIENALWRIWTFCKLFGKGTSRDAGIHDQIMWLEGTKLTENGDKYVLQPDKRAIPPSKIELEDMCEMWRCMESLLSNFRGREPEAREAGIFDQCQLDEKDGRSETSFLEDWIYDILSVGPKAVLTMISCSFEHAKVLGVNKWTPPRPGRSRRTFLKAALEQVYRDRLVEEARIQAQHYAKSVQQQQSRKQQQPVETQRQRASNIKSRSEPNLAEKVVAPASQPMYRSTSATPIGESKSEKAQTKAHAKAREVCLEIRPDCDPESSLGDYNQLPSNSPTTNPASFSSLAMMSHASARLGATLFPIQQTLDLIKKESSRETLDSGDADSIDLSIEPKVVDPSDRALALLVKQLGFPEGQAKQALAMSDDGAGIDVQRAVELLSNDRRLVSNQKEAAVAELPGHQLGNPTSKSMPELPLYKDYCEGTCRRPAPVARKKSTFRGLINRTSIRQSFRLSVIMDQEDEDEAVQQFVKDSIAPKTAAPTPTSARPKSPDSKPAYQNLADLVKSRKSTRSQSNVNRTNSFIRTHRKSSSAGTIESSEEDTNKSTSPISPMTPVHCLGGLTPIKPQSRQSFDNGHESDRMAQITTRPKVTLTRVGTGKKPSRRMSFGKGGGTMKPGQPPEIIGYTY